MKLVIRRDHPDTCVWHHGDPAECWAVLLAQRGGSVLSLRSAPRCWIHHEPDSDSIARSKLARPLVNASVERFSRPKHVFTSILLQSSILHRLFGCVRSVSENASYCVQGHSVNARMQTYADAQ